MQQCSRTTPVVLVLVALEVFQQEAGEVFKRRSNRRRSGSEASIGLPQIGSLKPVGA